MTSNCSFIALSTCANWRQCATLLVEDAWSRAGLTRRTPALRGEECKYSYSVNNCRPQWWPMLISRGMELTGLFQEFGGVRSLLRWAFAVETPGSGSGSEGWRLGSGRILDLGAAGRWRRQVHGGSLLREERGATNRILDAMEWRFLPDDDAGSRLLPCAGEADGRGVQSGRKYCFSCRRRRCSESDFG